MIWHDGLSTGAVTSLRGAERDEALVMLRLGVSLGDAHAAEALAAMGDRASEAEVREQSPVGLERRFHQSGFPPNDVVSDDRYRR